MCNYYVDFEDVSKFFNVALSDILNIIQYSESNFNDLILDDLISLEGKTITVKNNGRLFTRNISMRFDPLIKKKIGPYSKTI